MIYLGNKKIPVMKNQILISLILLLTSFVLYLDSFCQISRGTQSGEIYIPSTWYYQGGQNNYDAIFYSDNYGETLEIKYVYNVGSGNMGVGRLISDASIGVIYNNINSLWVSYDSASTWSFIEDIGTDKRYTSGCIDGEIYKYCKNPTSFLYRSIDYGQTFEEINSGVFGFPEVGTNEGELYILTGSTWPAFNIDLLLSTNFGFSFDSIIIDTTIAGHYISGNFPLISRGNDIGEVYLVSWRLPSNYHIYYSNDYGENFDLRFVSTECEFYYERYFFTAGRESGEFYVVKRIPWVDGINTELYIYHSNDTANSFTEYYHFLDENFPVNTYENKYFTNAQAIESYPNPFFDETKILVTMEVVPATSYIQIHNMFGQLVKTISLKNERQVIWDGTDINGKKVKGGIYFYSLIVDKKILNTNKLFFIN